jgi:hypothetical protein
MLNITKVNKFKLNSKSKIKTQIILCHTSKEVTKYLDSLESRYNGNYDKIPNFLITKDGEVIQLLEDNVNSNFFFDNELNKKSIIISLENYGWLQRKELSNEYITWDQTIYNGEVYKKKWRGMFFWDPYTQSQQDTLVELCLDKIEINKIPRKFTSHSGLYYGIKEFRGVTCRSNYNLMYTDLNPSFNYEKFLTKIEHE